MIEKENQFSFAASFKKNTPRSEFFRTRGDATWHINDSSFDDYSGKIDFPGLGNLRGILERQIGYDSSNTGLDVAGGSQGIAIQDLLRADFIGKGLVTNFEDLRTKKTKKIDALDHIAGDVANTEVWQSIFDWKEEHSPEGFSVILHRPAGGLQDFGPNAYAPPLHFLLDTLKPGGVLFTQVPVALRLSPRQTWFPIHLSVRSRSDIKDISYAPPAVGSRYPHVVITKHSERK